MTNAALLIDVPLWCETNGYR